MARKFYDLDSGGVSVTRSPAGATGGTMSPVQQVRELDEKIEQLKHRIAVSSSLALQQMLRAEIRRLQALQVHSGGSHFVMLGPLPFLP